MERSLNVCLLFHSHGFIIVSKTATNSAVARIRDKERGNAKFSFLNPGDAYHPYYLFRLSETRAGRSTAVAAGRADAASTVAPVPEEPKGPVQPPDFVFSARMPAINAQDLYANLSCYSI